MPREKRTFTRISGVRNPSLIVIASEGRKTEPSYFKGVAQKCAERSRIKIEVLPERKNHTSAAKDILAQMDAWKKEFGLGKGDELCIVIDRDPQSLKQDALSLLAQECDKKQYLLALSNPCFELWLLLHLDDVTSYSEAKKQQLFNNKNHYAKRKLREVNGQYNPIKINIDDFWQNTTIAIARAKALDTNPAHRWPQQLGTRVYLILEKIQMGFR